MREFGVFHSEKGVWFAIDHQRFTLSIPEPQEEDGDKTKYYAWWAEQLIKALRRLRNGEEQGPVV